MLPDTASLTLALSAGLVAAVNPCGFALLPAYLTLFVLDEAPRSPMGSVVRALRASAALTVGFALVFITFGLALAPVASSVQAYLPAFTVVLGVLLALVGLYLASGRELPQIKLPTWSKNTTGTTLTASWPTMIGFGSTYATASLGCTIAPFLAVVVTSFRSGSTIAGVVLFAAYALGMGLAVSVAAVSVALARRGLVTGLRRAGSWVPRVGGMVLASAGAYVAWYGLWELRVLNGGAGQDPIVAAASGLQQRLASGFEAVGVGGLVVALCALVALATVLGFVRVKRANQPRQQAPSQLASGD